MTTAVEVPPNDTQRTLERVRRLRHLARTDLFFLMREILGYKDVDDVVHGPIVNAMPQFPPGQDALLQNGAFDYRPGIDIWHLQGKRSRLFLYPRGHLKTSIITVAGTIQWILNYPDIRILITSATGDLPQKILLEIKSHFQFNTTLRAIFPEYCPLPKKAGEFGNMESFTVPCRKLRKLKEPTCSVSSVGKAIAGSHYEVLTCSDMVDKENVKTPGGIKEVIDHYNYMDPLLERSEVPPHHGWVTVEGTSYSFADLYSHLLNKLGKRLTEFGTGIETLESDDWIIVHGDAEVSEREQKTIWPARFPWGELKKMELKMGTALYCFPAETPILMADWTEKPIGDIQQGEEVVGYEFGRGNGKTTRLIKTKVLAIGNRTSPVVEVVTKHGRRILCTPDHKFWTGRTGGDSHKAYLPPKIGREIFRVYSHRDPPNPIAQRDLDWLGGMFDGEGSCSTSGTPSLCQSARNPDVCQEIEKVLSSLDIPFSLWTQQQTKPNWSEKRMYQLRNARSTSVILLTHARMSKRQRFIDRCWKRSNQITETGGCDKVAGIRFIGYDTVYSIETITGNYVAWGYAVKNSAQMRNRPIADDGGLATEDELQWFNSYIFGTLMPRLRVHTTIDLASMDTKSNGDFTVITTTGFDRNGRVYVLDIRRGRFSPSQVLDHIFEVHQKFRPLDIKIEKDAHARVFQHILAREQERRQVFPRWVLIRRDTHTSKQHRIRGLQPWFSSRIIRFYEGLECKTDLIREIVEFPNSAHDDILDTIADQMQNADGSINYDVIPAVEAPAIPSPRAEDKFLGFDPLSKEATFLFDQVSPANQYYDRNGI